MNNSSTLLETQESTFSSILGLFFS